jgi:uncharacterized protein YlxP (DUF503 family)
VIRPLTSALRQRCNVSVAETAHQDLWRRAEIAGAAVGSEPRVVAGTLRATNLAVDGEQLRISIFVKSQVRCRAEWTGTELDVFSEM